MADDPAPPMTKHIFGQIAALMGNTNQWCDICGKDFFEIGWGLTARYGDDYMKTRTEAEVHDLLKEIHPCFKTADVPTARGGKGQKAPEQAAVKIEDGAEKEGQVKAEAGSVGEASGGATGKQEPVD